MTWSMTSESLRSLRSDMMASEGLVGTRVRREWWLGAGMQSVDEQVVQGQPAEVR